MGFVMAILFWFVGLIIGSFGIIQMLTVTRFSIPYTKELNAQGLLENAHVIIKSDIKTIFIWSIITVVSTILIYNLASSISFYFYLVGAIIAVVFGYGYTGKTESNINEYVGNYRQFFILEDEYIEK